LQGGIITPRPSLSLERIVEAAAAVADTGGLSAVSMRSVARQLSVEAMSLYHHVPNKEALLDALADWVFTLIDLPESGQPWRAATERRASSTRHVLTAHPWAPGLMNSRPVPGPALMRHHDRALGAFLDDGFAVPLASSAVSMIDAYVYGVAVTEQSLPFSAEDETDDYAATLDVPMAEYPHLARMMLEFFDGKDRDSTYEFADEFTIGLTLILDAIEQRHARDARDARETPRDSAPTEA
jgi:AcrR family transcriptional regulator